MINFLTVYAQDKDIDALRTCVLSIKETFDRDLYLNIILATNDKYFSALSVSDVKDLFNKAGQNFKGADITKVSLDKLSGLNIGARRAYEIATYHGSRNLNLFWLGNLCKFDTPSWLGRLEDVLRIVDARITCSNEISVGGTKVSSGNLVGMTMQFFMHLTFTRKGNLLDKTYKTWRYACAEVDLFAKTLGYSSTGLSVIDQTLLTTIEEEDKSSLLEDEQRLLQDKQYAGLYSSIS